MQSKCLIIPPPPPPPPLPCRYTIWVERRFKKGGGGTKLACGPWLCPERATLQNKENIKINVFEVYCRQQDQTFSQRADRVLSAVPVTAME